jgi:seryl-tRNA synthetase
MIKLFFSVLLTTAFLILFSCNDAAVAENKVKTFEERFKELEAGIRNNADWLASIDKKAKERNIPLDSMLKLDIIWMIDEQDGKHKAENQPVAVTDTAAVKKTYDERVKEMIDGIKANKEWLAAIQKKADEKKISLDSMLLLDARWMIDEQDGKHK